MPHVGGDGVVVGDGVLELIDVLDVDDGAHVINSAADEVHLVVVDVFVVLVLAGNDDRDLADA